ncbi:hypothetical protein F5X98DRAFT_122062 [Xylaria grammica]|nr:hypothetical protein F5X98DRAFT_122062 [Xylaria grammica]
MKASTISRTAVAERNQQAEGVHLPTSPGDSSGRNPAETKKLTTSVISQNFTEKTVPAALATRAYAGAIRCIAPTVLGYQHGKRRCAGKWGDCGNMDGKCGTGTDFCGWGKCQSGNCTIPDGVFPASTRGLLWEHNRRQPHFGKCSSASPTTTTAPKTTTSLGNGIAVPAPYQPSMVSDCDEFHLVNNGDTCTSIAFN